MSNRRRVGTLEHAAVLFVAVLAAAFLLSQLGGCNVIGGLGRDLSAWADGGATEASENAAAIRNK